MLTDSKQMLSVITKNRQGKEEKYFIHIISKRKGHMEIKIPRYITPFGNELLKFTILKKFNHVFPTIYSSKSKALLKDNMAQAYAI